MKKQITFKELAKVSGVSIGTLSRYFNNGAISDAKKRQIKINLDKYNYVPNGAAIAMRKSQSNTIIIRTFIRSNTQDNIILGIVETLKNDNVIIKYSNASEKAVINSINWALTQRPKNLIVFAPLTSSVLFLNKITQVKTYCKVVIYDFINSLASSVAISFEKSFASLAQKWKKIYFIYENKNDSTSFQQRVMTLEKYFIEVIIKPANITYEPQNIYFFQSESLRSQIIAKLIAKNIYIYNVAISYDQPTFLNKFSYWIFIDHFLVGYTLTKLLNQKKVLNETINSNLIIKKNSS